MVKRVGMGFDEMVDLIGRGVDVAGIAVIVIGAVVGSLRYLSRVRAGAATAYRLYRVALGRTILLGLEFLIAGDIIRTVAASPTLQGVGILGAIVLIRTFLSITLNLEVEGRLPWRGETEPKA
jgi:uncharacterized membrane protein